MTDQLYIRSTIGESLMEALDSLIEANKITPELAHRVAQEVSAERRTGKSLWSPDFIEQPLPIPLQFDASILRSLEKKVTAKSSFKGQLDTYRYCDNASWGWGHEMARGVSPC